MTTVGFGDVRPTNQPEIILNIVWMLFGVVFWTFVIGNLTAAFTETSEHEQEMRKKVEIVRCFAKNYKLSIKNENKLKSLIKYQ